MSEKEISINSVGEDEVELFIPTDLYLALEKIAKLKGMSVKDFISSVFMRDHSTDK